MKDTADPVFEFWATDLENINNPTLQARSRERYEAARQRYGAILKSLEPALATCTQLNTDVRDHMLFLGHDLNPQSLADIQDGVQMVAQSATEVDQGIEQALGAARQYLEAASLPVGAPAAPSGEGEQRTQQSMQPRSSVRLDGSRGSR